MKIIAFTGKPFSGKSEAVEIAKQQDLPVIRMGDMVWDEVRNRNLPLNSETVGHIAQEMRKKFGTDYWAQKTIAKVKDFNDSPIIVIDGIRSGEEINRFRNELSNRFLLIAITATDEIRYKRAMARGRIDDSLDIKQIQERDKREEAWGLEEVIQNADIHIPNNEDLESFRKKIKQVFQNNLSIL